MSITRKQVNLYYLCVTVGGIVLEAEDGSIGASYSWIFAIINGNTN